MWTVKRGGGWSGRGKKKTKDIARRASVSIFLNHFLPRKDNVYSTSRSVSPDRPDDVRL
jgi:hypothetical protein